MKRIRNISITLLLMVLVVLSAQAQTEYVIGYCDEELPQNSIGLEGGPLRLSAAIHLPKSKMLRYEGCRLTKIRFAVKAGFENVSVWVRTSLNTSSKIIQSVPELENGWNEVVLNTPYLVDGNDLYIGYTATQPAGFSGIAAQGEGNEYTSWLAVDNQWSDYSQYGLGILYIQGVVEGEVLDNDIAMLDLAIDKKTYTTDETIMMKGAVINAGSTTIEGYQLSVGIDDAIPSVFSYNSELLTEQTVDFEMPLSLEDLEAGRHELVVKVTPENITDEKAGNDEIRVPFYIYTGTYPRMLLLEHFTSLPCVNCPPVDNILEEVAAGRSDVAWVSHHVGYRDDEFTLESSRQLTRFGVDGNPYLMIDRTTLADNDTPAFTINANAQPANVVNTLYFDKAAARPAFLQLSVAGDASNNVLNIRVEGDAKSYINELYPRATLHIFLVEDQVEATKPQAGNSNKKIHDNILRAFVTPTRGVLPNWNEHGKFTYDTTFDLDPLWEQSNLRVVAFMTTAADAETDYPTGAVVNAMQQQITTDSSQGISLTEYNDAETSYYNLWGQRVNNPQGSRGLYIVKNGNSANNKKIIVK